MKIKRTIIGVVMTVMLLASFMAVATPASAGTQSWTAEDLPFDKTNVQATDTNIVDIAISDDGDVVYVVTGVNNGLYRSTDGGKTWNQLDTEGSIVADFVAAAPDASPFEALAIYRAMLEWARENKYMPFTFGGTHLDAIADRLNAENWSTTYRVES